jgi:ankyrin repeat protein
MKKIVILLCIFVLSGCGPSEVEKKSSRTKALVSMAEAFDSSDIDKLKALISEGVYLDTVVSKGETPLMKAVAQEKLVIAQILIDAGANVNANASTSSALSHAIRTGNIDFVKLVLDAGASPNNLIYVSELQIAIINNRPEMVELLLKAGADTTYTNIKGQTALELAKEEGFVDIIEIIEKHK